MNYNNLNNPLLNDKVIQRDYGMGTTETIEPPKIKDDIEQPVDLGGDPPEIDNSSIEEEFESQVDDQSDLGDLGDLGFDIKSMSFVDDPEDDEDDEPDMGSATTVKPDNAAVKSLASVVTGIIVEYVPKLASFPAKQPIGELHEAVEYGLPKSLIGEFETYNIKIEDSLKLTENEAKELRKALIAYMKTKDMETVSEGHALALQLGVIGIRLAVESVKMRAERIQFRDAIFDKYNIKIK